MALQSRLAAKIVLRDDFGPVRRVAGVDVGFEDDGATTRAAVAVLGLPSLQLETCAIARQPTRFPYVPGLLSFREAPAVLAAMRASCASGRTCCSATARASPIRAGSASPATSACSSTFPPSAWPRRAYIGRHQAVPEARGAWVPLEDGGEIVGAVLRTRCGVKPLYISPGHRIGLESAIAWVMACLTRYRLPETTRWAHRLASGK
jgi:deoxyribonuclease V